jgi:hypothetical protein
MAMPARAWLASYDRTWLRGDVVAGVTLAAYLLPAAIGDASLAGLPPQAGLYACLFAGLLFWLFCSSRQTVVGVTSAISLLIGATLGEMSDGDPARQAALAACTGLMVAALAFAAWRRAPAPSSISSRKRCWWLQVRRGAVPGEHAAAQAVRLQRSHGDFWERMGHFLRGLGGTNPTSLALGAAALVLLLLGKGILKNRPVALFVVIGGIVAARMFHLDARGVALLGEVPGGLPMPAVPPVSRADLNALLPLALACLSSRRWKPPRLAGCSRRSTAIASTPPGIPRDQRRQLAAGLGAGLPSAAACRSRSSTKRAAPGRRSQGWCFAHHARRRRVLHRAAALSPAAGAGRGVLVAVTDWSRSRRCAISGDSAGPSSRSPWPP